MATISAQEVKTLRERTGCGMMECKKALVETEGDMEKAITLLREKGLATAEKKASRIAAEGYIGIYNDGKVAALAEVNCETDFVAKNEQFQEFANKVAEIVAKTNPANLDVLMGSKYNSDMTVEDVRKEKVMVIRENITVRRFVRMEGNVFTYNHGNGKIGVITQFEAADASSDDFAQMGKNVCMQVAAMNPSYLGREDVPSEVIEKEKEIMMVQIKNDPKTANKPPMVIEKMVTGKLGKYYSEFCLLDQAYFMDETMTVGQYVESKAKEYGQAISLKSYVRFERGEGIQKREDNFAEEVAKMNAK